MTKLFIPLLSLFTYVLGSHAMNIAVSFFLSVENYSQWDIGVMNSFGYLGLFFAGFYTDRLIANLGHVLAFMISACLAAFCGIVFFLDPSFYFQLIIRLSLGFIVGLMYVVIESWVLTLTPDHQRGESFSYYMVVLYLAQALSPFLLEVRFTYLKTV
jgi:MFS family permease